jgi:hypothetical protein
MSLPLLGAGMATDGPSAVLDLNFASLLSLTPSVGPTPSFTRASTGTYFNSSGVLTTAAINGPRFDHVYNGSSWVSKGLLIEEARTNSLIQSGDISNAAYTKSFLTAPVSAVLSPDGSTYANALTEDTTTNIHRFYRNTTAAAGKTVTFSIFLKAGTARYAVVCHSDNVDFRSFCVADLQTGTITNSGVVYAATGASYIGSTISNCGNGWYRVSLTGTNLNTDGNYYTQVGISNSSTSTGFPSYLGSGQIIYAFGLQLEFDSAFATSYIPTTTATVTRSADVCQITGGDFSGFWNATEGSFAVEYDRLYLPVTGGAVYSARDAANNNAFYSYVVSSSELIESYTSGVQATLAFGPPSAVGVLTKNAGAYKLNNFAASRNGGTVVTDTAGTVPVSPTSLAIGDTGLTASVSILNGHIARLRYFNTRLTNSELVELST